MARNATSRIRIHPFLAAFPESSLAERETLRADIEANGLHRPLVRTRERQPQLVDGRDRLWACEQLGLEPTWEDIEPADAEAWAVGENLLRRHLDTSQRAMVAARLATLRHGERPDDGELTVDGAAEKLTVGEKSVRLARKVLESGDAALIAAVDGRQLSVSSAAGLVDRPDRERKATLELIGGGRRPAAAARAARAAPKRGPVYETVFAPSLPGDEALPLAENGHLWVGAAPAELPDALRALRAAGCKYQGLLVLSERTGLTLVLHGARGAPEAEETTSAVVTTERELRDAIAEACPGERIDLESRTAQDGWTLLHAARTRKPGAAPPARRKEPERRRRGRAAVAQA